MDPEPLKADDLRPRVDDGRLDDEVDRLGAGSRVSGEVLHVGRVDGQAVRCRAEWCSW